MDRHRTSVVIAGPCALLDSSSQSIAATPFTVASRFCFKCRTQWAYCSSAGKEGS
jgi:hypothetical protein